MISLRPLCDLRAFAVQFEPEPKADLFPRPDPRRGFCIAGAEIGRSLRGMSDSIADLTSQIQAFVDAREWRKFHNAKDLAVAISAEAGELMQHFVWQQNEQIEERLEAHREEIASEIADVAILLFEFADNLGYKLGDVMQDKIARNDVRYPVEKSRGNNLKYSEL
jgi:dCTP diphosphatase